MTTARPTGLVAGHALTVPVLTGIGSVALLLLTASSRGLGLSHDSITYVSTGRKLADGHGLISFGSSELVSWPPMMALIASIMEVFGLNAFDGMLFVNALVFGGVVLLSTNWLLKNLNNRVLAASASISIALAPPMIFVHSWLWSEPLFVLIITAGLVQAGRTYLSPSVKSVALLGLLAGLAFYTRYAGGTLMLTGGLILILAPASLKQRINYLGIFLAVSFVPAVAWLIRNLVVADSLVGPRDPSGRSMMEVIEQVISVLLIWFVPSTLVNIATEIVFFLAGMVVLATIAVVLRKRMIPEQTVRVGLPVLIFTIIYLAFIVSATTRTAIDAPNSRMLSPVYIPLLLLIFLSADSAVLMTRRSLKHTGAVISVMGVALALLIAGRGVAVAREIQIDGIGLTSTEWQAYLGSEILDAPISGVIYSNHPEALYFHDGTIARFAPRRHALHSEETKTDDVNRFGQQIAANGEVFLLWADIEYRDYLVPVDQLADQFSSQLIESDQFWSLYRFAE